jgi:hypothetical protein
VELELGGINIPSTEKTVEGKKKGRVGGIGDTIIQDYSLLSVIHPFI